MMLSNRVYGSTKDEVQPKEYESALKRVTTKINTTKKESSWMPWLVMFFGGPVLGLVV